jgi:hypothetical protein
LRVVLFLFLSYFFVVIFARGQNDFTPSLQSLGLHIPEQFTSFRPHILSEALYDEEAQIVWLFLLIDPHPLPTPASQVATKRRE